MPNSKQREPLGKKKVVVTPTIRQRKAAELLSESMGSSEPKSMGEVLQEAGYSKATSETPTLVTRSEGFIQLMEQMGITDDRLGQVLQDGLEAQTYIKTERVEGQGKTRLKTEEITGKPDHNVRHRYLETALKLKGLSKGGDGNVTFNLVAGQQRVTYNLS